MVQNLMLEQRMPVYFLSHGGGPWPYMQGPFRDMMRWLEASLNDIPNQLPHTPKAILIASAHWEESAFKVTSSPAPGMVYDFTGFPVSTYSAQYTAPGSPELAIRIAELLDSAGLPTGLDASRGLDHGSYSVVQPMFPLAQIPVVQMSLHQSLDPELHLRAGAAIAPLREANVLIIGSGMSCHGRTPDMAAPSAAFDAWMRSVLLDGPPEERHAALRQWDQAPWARKVHSREEHLLPLMLAAGAAGADAASCIYSEKLLDIFTVSSFGFGTRSGASRFDLHAGNLHPALASGTPQPAHTSTMHSAKTVTP